MTGTTHWQKSSFSDGSDGDACVEVAAAPGAIRLRESDDPAVELTTGRAALAHLLRDLKGRAAPPDGL
ncbi:DUF397 domain-containing protein [Streptomyces spectabilis]|uniref:DUF397 domain-containing protein n=1 Tax=Streptomyces spectabilis TaxID=68270 RepID=A0A5P2X4V6_STRST|nr:DUF397 domain-containing protein [Streptomyces spectabilis]MBB5109118.1 hypothetical protein [Streptomyces spectabilis]MCI3902760.1 DUF397 domain-containing protein [Streptomyces spectabilis]QEV60057.1 DUF397 domain-containing protein [Streptomyces spectabilis]GGV44827.1 hypothetical protein GCM10010245_70160 [Streptomyces spectabilis]